MKPAARFVVAGLVALAVVVSHSVYRAWPGWFGAEIRLPASIYPIGPTDLGYVGIDLPAERLLLDNDGAPPVESFQVVRGNGIGGGLARRRLRGQVLFVQFESMRPVSISLTAITGVTSMAGRVIREEKDGRLWLNFGSRQLPLPPDVAARARPLEVVREPNRRPEERYRQPDPGTLAVFRVLPSGRAALVGVVFAQR